MEHHVSLHAAAHVADNAGLPLLRARYLAETHELVGQTLEYRPLARPDRRRTTAAMTSRSIPPSPGPPRAPRTNCACSPCTAGAPMPTAACGIDLLGPHCPQRDKCAHWIRRSLCGTAPLVGMVIDRAFDHSLPRELSAGFDFTIIDEGLDRVQFAPWEMPLDLLADHHFDQHPVLTDGQPDDALTEEARKGFAWLRYVVNGVEAGYLPAEERDVDRLLRLIELDRGPRRAAQADRRPRPATIAPASPDRASGRRSASCAASCAHGLTARAGSASSATPPSTTAIGQIAIVRPKRSLHSVVHGLAARC